MNATADSGMFEERYEPGFAQSMALALTVHLLLAVVLFFGVRWQNRPPETVSVELWAPPPEPVVERPEPPKPQPKVEPAPPPKPEPVIEKPEIALKAPPKPKPKPEPPKAVPKPEPARPVAKARDDPMKRRMMEELAREQTALNLDRERTRVSDLLKGEAQARDAKAIAGWVDKVRAKIRGNVVMPPEVKGNPEAIFDVVQLPTGEALSVKLRRSSGNRALDDAIERAILKSSPLPRPDRPELFTRAFELKYRPRDD
jgi:colicin import membrane protein